MFKFYTNVNLSGVPMHMQDYIILLSVSNLVAIFVFSKIYWIFVLVYCYHIYVNSWNIWGKNFKFYICLCAVIVHMNSLDSILTIPHLAVIFDIFDTFMSVTSWILMLEIAKCTHTCISLLWLLTSIIQILLQAFFICYPYLSSFCHIYFNEFSTPVHLCIIAVKINDSDNILGILCLPAIVHGQFSLFCFGLYCIVLVSMISLACFGVKWLLWFSMINLESVHYASFWFYIFSLLCFDLLFGLIWPSGQLSICN